MILELLTDPERKRLKIRSDGAERYEGEGIALMVNEKEEMSIGKTE